MTTEELRFERKMLTEMPQTTCEIRRRIENIDFEIRHSEIEQGKLTGCTQSKPRNGDGWKDFTPCMSPGRGGG